MCQACMAIWLIGSEIGSFLFCGLRQLACFLYALSLRQPAVQLRDVVIWHM